MLGNKVSTSVCLCVLPRQNLNDAERFNFQSQRVVSKSIGLDIGMLDRIELRGMLQSWKFKSIERSPQQPNCTVFFFDLCQIELNLEKCYKVGSLKVSKDSPSNRFVLYFSLIYRIELRGMLQSWKFKSIERSPQQPNVSVFLRSILSRFGTFDSFLAGLFWNLKSQKRCLLKYVVWLV